VKVGRAYRDRYREKESELVGVKMANERLNEKLKYYKNLISVLNKAKAKELGEKKPERIPDKVPGYMAKIGNYKKEEGSTQTDGVYVLDKSVDAPITGSHQTFKAKQPNKKELAIQMGTFVDTEIVDKNYLASA
jgi:hypothetical protein